MYSIICNIVFGILYYIFGAGRLLRITKHMLDNEDSYVVCKSVTQNPKEKV